jgi:threonine synthase
MDGVRPQFENAHTFASVRVPRAIGDFVMLDILKKSHGGAIAVTDKEMIDAAREIGAREGIFCAPEGAACLPALRTLVQEGSVSQKDRVVIFNTGAGGKYMEAFTEQ